MNGSCWDQPTPVGILIVVSPIEVEVAVGVDDREVGVVIRINPGSKRLLHHPYHCPLNTLGAVFYLGYLIRQCKRPSNVHFWKICG